MDEGAEKKMYSSRNNSGITHRNSDSVSSPAMPSSNYYSQANKQVLEDRNNQQISSLSDQVRRTWGGAVERSLLRCPLAGMFDAAIVPRAADSFAPRRNDNAGVGSEKSHDRYKQRGG